jgi:hypothetical protein
MRTHPCPKCGRTLEQSGEVTAGGHGPFPVFQCDDCIVDADVFGETFPVAYTFALDEQGRVFDPDFGPPGRNGSG